MKRLIFLFWLILGASAFGINITNYPATNAFDGSMTFLLSKASAATNFNIQADLIASTNWAIGTFLPASGNAVSSTYVTTSPLTNHVNIANVDTPGAIVTNQNAWTLNLATNLTVGGASNVLAVTVASSSSNTNNVVINAGSDNTLVVTNGRVGIGTNNPTKPLFVFANGAVDTVSMSIQNGTASGDAQVSAINNAGARATMFKAGSSYPTYKSIKPSDLGFYNGTTSGDVEIFNDYASGKIEMTTAGRNSPDFSISSSGGVTIGSTLTATNGVTLMVKPSFTTNLTCTTNLQVYLCNGTNQIVTLPNAAYVPNVVYRFPSTNGWAKFTITNATGAQTIRDGTSLSFTQVGIGSPAFFSDGAHWWPAARTKVIMPNAQFACSTNIPLTVANSNYPVTFDSIANESQGIALGTNGTGAWSVMWITNSGQYEFIPSIVERFSANHIIRYWLKSNGTNIPASGTPAQGAAGGTTIRVITVSFKVDVTAPTAFEIWAQSDNTGDDFYAEAASGNYPAAPSVICPVKRISDNWP